MQIFLGDEVTLLRNGTSVSGQVSGIILNDKRELERLYVYGIDQAFWMDKGWTVIDYDEEEEDGEV